MKRNIKNNIILFFLLFFITIEHIYAISFEPYDELWNFQSIYKLYLGNTIYSDVNIVVTPLFYFISLIFFKIFGISLIKFRIFNVCIVIFLFFILYKIFEHLKVSKHLNYVFLVLILVQILPVVNGGANYNMLCIMFVLLGILSYLKLNGKKYYDFLQGFIIFLIFFTKQNIGIYYTCSILIFEFIYRKKLKDYFISIIKMFAMFFLHFCIAIIVFVKNDILWDFINCTFGGISDFGNSNFAFNASSHIVVIMVITLILYFYMVFSKKEFIKSIITFERKKVLNFIGIVTLGVSLSVFPIVNTAHLLYVFPLFSIILFYFLDFTILEELLDSQPKIQKTIFVTAIILVFLVIKMFVTYVNESKTYTRVLDKNNPFYQTLMSNDNFEKMNTMIEYIKNTKKNVVIIAYDSALSMVPLNQNNGYFDLAFNGNLGYNGEENLIEKIQKYSNTEFLIITNETDYYWQESQEIREFIIENLEKSGEILNYSIYELIGK